MREILIGTSASPWDAEELVENISEVVTGDSDIYLEGNGKWSLDRDGLSGKGEWRATLENGALILSYSYGRARKKEMDALKEWIADGLFLGSDPKSTWSRVTLNPHPFWLKEPEHLAERVGGALFGKNKSVTPGTKGSWILFGDGSSMTISGDSIKIKSRHSKKLLSRFKVFMNDQLG